MLVEMKINNIVSINDFLDKKLLDLIFEKTAILQATTIIDLPQVLNNKIIANLFYEPSTRTRFSFETAVHRLGGDTISTENASEFSSTTKGESLEDTIVTLNAYVDGIVLRHPHIGSSQIAAKVSKVPIFNAGDGAGEHPTQALLDLYTIIHQKNKIDGLKIGLVGDLLNGRTIHSLINLLSLYNVQIYLIAPTQIQLPEKHQKLLNDKKIEIIKTSNLDDVIGELDVIYMTRIQKERFESIEEFNKLKHTFQLDKSILPRIKKDAIIMHPLPRNDEILPEIDSDPRAIYFQQAQNGLYLRMALFQLVYT